MNSKIKHQGVSKVQITILEKAKTARKGLSLAATWLPNLLR